MNPGRGLLLGSVVNSDWLTEPYIRQLADRVNINVTMNTSSAPKVPNVPPVRFIREVIAELKKVTWPTRGETVKLTAVVIAISVIVGAFVGILDYTMVTITSLIFK